MRENSEELLLELPLFYKTLEGLIIFLLLEHKRGHVNRYKSPSLT